MSKKKDEKPTETENKSESTSGNLTFFNTLRTLMVLCVVIFHATCAYVPDMVPFWPYHNPEASLMLDIVITFFDVFMMPTLFFISGYFSMMSIERKKALKFIKGKVKRLLLPWIFVLFLILPSLDYFFHYYYSVIDGLTPLNYLQYLGLSIKSIFNFKVGFLTMTQYVPMTEQIYQRYMWFLSLMFIFSVIFAISYTIREKYFKPGENKETTNKPPTKLFVFVGVIISTGFFLMDLLTSGNGFGWFTLGNLINFQPSKIFLYAGFFILGVYGQSNKWWYDGKQVARWRWTAIIFLIITPLIGRAYMRASEPIWWLQILMAFAFCFLSLSFLIGLTNIGLKRWNNKESFINKYVSEHSYNIYLLHYIPVMLLQFFLGFVILPPDLKWLIVWISVIFITYTTSRFVMKPAVKKLKM